MSQNVKKFTERKVHINGVFLEQGQKAMPTFTNLMQPSGHIHKLNTTLAC